MKANDKRNTQRIVTKIQSGVFDENDICIFFIRLREFSKNHLVFREIADFLAHSKQRDRGLANKSLENMYLTMKFFTEYLVPKKVFDVTKEFPLWAKSLMVLKVDKFIKGAASGVKDEAEEIKQLTKSIEKGFKDNKKNKTSTLIKGKLSDITIHNIQIMMNLFIVKPAFTQDELIHEVIGVMSMNEIEIDHTLFMNQGDKITLCLLLLIHNVTYDFNSYKLGSTKIGCEKDSIIINEGHVEKHGKLKVMGWVILDYAGKDCPIGHCIMTTNLSVDTWCENELFSTSTHTAPSGVSTCRKVDFDGDIGISNDFKLETIVS
jgi:peroxiredoxin family protein